MNYKSIADLNNDIIKKIPYLPIEIDLIIGLPRSGMIAASMLATHLNLPLIDCDGFICGRPAWAGVTKKLNERVVNSNILTNSQAAICPLLLDDSVFTGQTIQNALKTINERVFCKQILSGAVYVKPRTSIALDIIFQYLDIPRVFEWNILYHNILSQSCVDMDGILCRDPNTEENDDGEKYRKFINTVRVLNTPSVEIGWIVTCRLEKYRMETESWLKNNNIRYRNLIMIDLDSADERRKLGLHASFKSEVYKKTKALLFIESSYVQSLEIARKSKKYVFSYENRELIRPDGLNYYRAKKWPIFYNGEWKNYVPINFKEVYKRIFKSKAL